ncbi:MAG: hypothetical protein IIA61_03165 [Candidatus Marinimicrobia bacterium]|nr:hypothetical protein [Candidatus Neomarinimicrobiota bacterium]
MKPSRIWELSNEAIKGIFAFLLICILLLDLGCAIIKSGSPPKTHGYGDIDQYGCQEPPPDVFTSAGLDADFASSTFGKIVTGEIKVQTKPEVLDLASKAVHEVRIRDYLRCLAIKRDGYNLEQAAYLELFNAFMATNPSATEFIEWQQNNPFPITGLKQIENDEGIGSKNLKIKDSQQVENLQHVIKQHMEYSPGGIQVVGDLTVNPDPLKYLPIDVNIRTNVLASLKALRAEYGDACPIVKVSVEQGSRNRDRIVQDVIDLLKNAGFKPIPFSSKMTFRTGTPAAFQINLNPEDTPFVTDLFQAFSPFLRTDVVGKRSTNQPAGEVEMVFEGEPKFRSDGSIKFD